MQLLLLLQFCDEEFFHLIAFGVLKVSLFHHIYQEHVVLGTVVASFGGGGIFLNVALVSSLSSPHSPYSSFPFLFHYSLHDGNDVFQYLIIDSVLRTLRIFLGLLMRKVIRNLSHLIKTVQCIFHKQYHA